MVDVDGGVITGPGPCGVCGSFDVPLEVLAFDHAGCRAASTDGVEPAQEAAEEVEPAGAVPAVLVRGEKRPGGRGSGG
jgi:hypothetical protein